MKNKTGEIARESNQTRSPNYTLVTICTGLALLGITLTIAALPDSILGGIFGAATASCAAAVVFIEIRKKGGKWQNPTDLDLQGEGGDERKDYNGHAPPLA